MRASIRVPRRIPGRNNGADLLAWSQRRLRTFLIDDAQQTRDAEVKPEYVSLEGPTLYAAK
jgi:hypothetical protein